MLVWRCTAGRVTVQSTEQVWDAVGAEAGEDEVAEIVYNMWRLVCPLILMGPRVEEVYVRVNEQEYSTVMTITLDKALDWVKVF